MKLKSQLQKDVISFHNSCSGLLSAYRRGGVFFRSMIECTMIQKLPQEIRTLNLSNWSEPLREDKVLSYFTNVEILRLSDTQITDISFVSAMKELQVLHFDGAVICILAGRQNLELQVPHFDGAVKKVALPLVTFLSKNSERFVL